MNTSRLRISIGILTLIGSSVSFADEPPAGGPGAGRSVAGNERVQSVIESFGGKGVQADESQPKRRMR